MGENMEREILEAGRRLADYLRNNQIACLGKRVKANAI